MAWTDRTLLGALIGVMLYAAALVVAGGFVGDNVFDPLGFGPADGGIADGPPADYVRFVYGVLGAVIIGWMVTLLFIARGPLRRREPWAWWAVTAALSVWFVVDTGMSVALGWVSHGVFNVGFLVIAAVPMVAIRRELQAS